jgi:hypothetical protein
MQAVPDRVDPGNLVGEELDETRRERPQFPADLE